MKKTFDKINSNPLFKGIGLTDFEAMFHCMDAHIQRYRKNELLLMAGNPVDRVGLVVSGSVQILKEDAEGRQHMLAELGTSELFGEVFACAGVSHSPVTVRAAEDCEVVLFRFRKLLTICTSACPFHTRLIENMLMLLAKKNLQLNQKVEILTKRTIRERLLLFFDGQRGSATKFSIPFNREELASYLSVDRSALSAELSKMQQEGVLNYHRNDFELLL